MKAGMRIPLILAVMSGMMILVTGGGSLTFGLNGEMGMMLLGGTWAMLVVTKPKRR